MFGSTHWYGGVGGNESIGLADGSPAIQGEMQRSVRGGANARVLSVVVFAL